VPPGRYTLKLTVDGHSSTQTVTVRNDPRSPATLMALRAQDSLLVRISHAMHVAFGGAQQGVTLRTALTAATRGMAASETAAEMAGALVATIDSLTEESPSSSFRSLNSTFARQLTAQDNGDMVPTQAEPAPSC